MAKISTYPIASPVTLTDIVIGSDALHSNVTKNFTVLSILGLIGDYYADAGTGDAGYVLTSNGAGNAPTWQLSAAGAYVPYTGAVDDVDLGFHGIDALYVNSSSVQVYESLYISEDAPISLNGDEGNDGDVMISKGAITNPIWQSPSTFFANAVLTLPTYASNAAALAGGLVQGQLYASATGVVSIVL